MEMKFDEENITPSDFTVIIKGIPKDQNEDDIQKWVENHYFKDKIKQHIDEDIVVNNVCLAYYIGDYVALARKKQKFFDLQCLLNAQIKANPEND